MGFNKIYIDKDRIFSAWKAAGADGVAELWTKYDGIIMTDRMSMYIGTIMDKEDTLAYKMNLIEVYFEQLFEGLHKI